MLVLGSVNFILPLGPNPDPLRYSPWIATGFRLPQARAMKLPKCSLRKGGVQGKYHGNFHGRTSWHWDLQIWMHYFVGRAVPSKICNWKYLWFKCRSQFCHIGYIVLHSDIYWDCKRRCETCVFYPRFKLGMPKKIILTCFLKRIYRPQEINPD